MIILRGEEDYIKHIFDMEEHLSADEFLSNQAIAARLNHSASTVNEMIKKLAAKQLLTYKPYVGVRLTVEGNREAIGMIRKHRLWELFLFHHLQYSWDELHAEAEVLEHNTSDRLAESLYKFLGKPSVCPHGKPIPNTQGVLARPANVSLNQVISGKRYQLLNVEDQPQVLKYLDSIQYSVGTLFQVLNNDELNELVVVHSGQGTHTIGYPVARQIFVVETNS